MEFIISYRKINNSLRPPLPLPSRFLDTLVQGCIGSLITGCGDTLVDSFLCISTWGTLMTVRPYILCVFDRVFPCLLVCSRVCLFDRFIQCSFMDARVCSYVNCVCLFVWVCLRVCMCRFVHVFVCLRD